MKKALQIEPYDATVEDDVEGEENEAFLSLGD